MRMHSNPKKTVNIFMTNNRNAKKIKVGDIVSFPKGIRIFGIPYYGRFILLERSGTSKMAYVEDLVSADEDSGKLSIPINCNSKLFSENELSMHNETSLLLILIASNNRAIRSSAEKALRRHAKERSGEDNRSNSSRERRGA